VPEFLAAWLGLAQLGAWMVPINPACSPGELQYWLTDSGSEWLLIDATRLQTFFAIERTGQAPDGLRLLAFGDCDKPDIAAWSTLLAAANPTFTPRQAVHMDDVVNIQYTSGSTGKPKGCLLSHRYWLQAGKVISTVWPRFERIQCDLPFYYMGPLWRFAVAASYGAALCVPASYSLSRSRERIRDNQYHMAWANNAVAMLPPDPIERQNSLKMIAIFGLAKDLHRPLEERYGAPARESFGMTEVGIATYMPFEDGHMSGTGSCGIVAPFRQMEVFDPSGNIVPRGQIGEICIKGKGIFQRYHNKPEATSDSFHGEWFRSGDLGRMNEDGYFYIIGRIKDTIRRSGENISASEVEGALSTLTAIKEVAVHAVKDDKRGEEVKACIMLQEGLGPDDLAPETIIAHCLHRLTRFKVPRYIQYYRSLPRTGSDKIAKQRLIDGEGEQLSPLYDLKHTLGTLQPALAGMGSESHLPHDRDGHRHRDQTG
jgi:acyl-CoA synthetase (AMP-forming)/AMP-acid ligase II